MSFNGIVGSTQTRRGTLQILFVCTGNICRSPTAERLAVAYSTRLEIPDFIASSAGIRAVIHHPMQRDATLVLEKLGGDATGFAARQLTPKIVSDAGLILTMTRAHRDTVLGLAPRQLHRVFTLIEAAQIAPYAGDLTELAALRPRVDGKETLDIPDPIGQTREVFEIVGAQIAECLPPILELCQRS